MKKITLDAIYGDAKVNEFMHAADVFENFKQYAILNEVEMDVTFGDDEIERAENTINILKDALEKSGQNVVFIAIKTIDNVRRTMKNYLKENVSVISTGEQWVMFSELLKKLGYKVETNDQMQVISVN
jgi:hypothetical protein